MIVPSLTAKCNLTSFNWGLDRSSLTTAGLQFPYVSSFSILALYRYSVLAIYWPFYILYVKQSTAQPDDHRTRFPRSGQALRPIWRAWLVQKYTPVTGCSHYKRRRRWWLTYESNCLPDLLDTPGSFACHVRWVSILGTSGNLWAVFWADLSSTCSHVTPLGKTVNFSRGPMEGPGVRIIFISK